MMLKSLPIMLLPLAFLFCPCVEACHVPPSTDSLKVVLEEKVSEMQDWSDFVTSLEHLRAAQEDIDKTTSDVERLYLLHGADIAEDATLADLYDKFTSLRKEINDKALLFRQEREKDSVIYLFQDLLRIYDSLYSVGKQLSAEKDVEAVVAMKQQEKDQWILAKTLESGNKSLLQSFSELQETMDTINARHEQISALSEEKANSLLDILLKILPIVIAIVPIVIMVKAKVNQKNVIGGQGAKKEVPDNANKSPEESVNVEK